MGGHSHFLPPRIAGPWSLAALAALVLGSWLQDLLDATNQIATGPQWEGVRYLITFALSLFAFVRLVLPPILENIRTKRLAATRDTHDGPVTYRKLWEDEVEKVLDQHVELENLRTECDALRARNTQLADLLIARGTPLPVGPPEPHPKSRRELLADAMPDPPQETP